MKKNKGFSIVELLIVILIMVVLAGVIAPMLIKYINKSRISKDVDTGYEIAKAILTVVSEDKVFDNAEEHADPYPLASMDGNDFKKAVEKHLNISDINDIRIETKHDRYGVELEDGSPKFYYTLDSSKNKVEVFMGGTTADYRVYPTIGNKFVE